MKFQSLVILSLITQGLMAQSYNEEIRAWQINLNKEYADHEKSPLSEEDIENFKGLNFFPINDSFNFEAEFKRTFNQKPFKMPTSTDRLPVYEKYGTVNFSYKDKNYTLNVYQSHDLRKTEEYKDYLFLPFTDATNGNETYGGGRYISLSIPDSSNITIDFNKAYNPYCAYNNRYSCPIPPKENDLKIKIRAGVKLDKHNDHQ
jgi:hypothetical protein